MSQTAASRRVLQRIRRWGSRLVIALLGAWIAALLIFAVLPVPYSTVMVQRQVGAWLHGDFSYVAHQTWRPMSQIAPPMALAVIAAEDQKFPQHWGFDLTAIGQALDSADEGGRPLRGASTLSQQTMKNLLLWDGRSWLRKGLEAPLTLAEELVWSKRRILTVYLNIAEFGPGVFGVEEAAQRYFHKPASRLTAGEAALLAAVLPNPHRFSVRVPSRYVLQRQRWILRQMRQLGGEAFLQRYDLR
ncbi:monofunctional biosynthetic peptidoglycan transglycosylase [Edwardsiella piscicida]|uniref:monofunctional biosynthetic peptidoglycan transglycosylase n=1 Tax=Edwardsiella piscicida TaxID=1263550 RepID=UPI00084C82D8|nr:monofunctional biosynthetic peptidoglycan transglycosylase [Edwardsiella piscicida]EKS7766659.1 monofunctional biosynthetic peptidoglycan transglycosylase [Edwardsiella piscicida]EKS7813652.1 monofunctional biosynthetic peptidoglycan transglycosylase [Edwardsiella piscicida]UCQ21603.1 monofunctional biosynthetic peptidoglycan transglycosylase [Edwardsiella piscicida]UCQ31788.1 monofunctional biosynthetic peptidoglycan transglycosylase [Edwardsiella piscicida]UCQ58115.1 monofunctional biosyn